MRGLAFLASLILLAGAAAANDAIRVPVPAKKAAALAEAPQTTATRPSPVAVYYNYDQAREVREDFANAGDTSGNPPREDRASLTIDGRDFNGGVGYGQNGDLDYPGGYGRVDPYNGNTNRNGAAMAAAAARFNAWHGYNARKGAGR